MTTESCAYCTLDSVGACPVCQRRICNRHMIVSVRGISQLEGFNTFTKARAILHHPVGETVLTQPVTDVFANGPARCESCRSADERAAADVYAAQVAEARTAFVADLQRAADHDSLPGLLGPHVAKVPDDLIQELWDRFITGRSFEATHRIVMVSGRLGWMGPQVMERDVTTARAFGSFVLLSPDLQTWHPTGVPWVSKHIDTRDSWAVPIGSEIRFEKNAQGAVRAANAMSVYATPVDRRAMVQVLLNPKPGQLVANRA